jgi:hypothetical protein
VALCPSVPLFKGIEQGGSPCEEPTLQLGHQPWTTDRTREI